MPIPKPDIEGIKKFKHYREKGLTYKEIETLMKKQVRTLSRWNTYINGGILEEDKLSTDSQK